jgi:hypothetical protein
VREGGLERARAMREAAQDRYRRLDPAATRASSAKHDSIYRDRVFFVHA